MNMGYKHQHGFKGEPEVFILSNEFQQWICFFFLFWKFDRWPENDAQIQKTEWQLWS